MKMGKNCCCSGFVVTRIGSSIVPMNTFQLLMDKAQRKGGDDDDYHGVSPVSYSYPSYRTGGGENPSIPAHCGNSFVTITKVVSLKIEYG
mmetsp:Transcript_39649/g.40150  ORF Transcript_39649/g.40150 Transcript_39649/m.40150 type:complete len:90 (+) Transcript_39649:642-911(+)